MKPRHQLYLDETLTAELEMLAAKPGTSKSAIVADALRAYLGRQGARELDDALKTRFDRVTAHLSRIERDQRVLLETVAQFVRHFFTVTPPLPEGERAAARALAEHQFQSFIAEVGQRIGTAKAAQETVSHIASVPNDREKRSVA